MVKRFKFRLDQKMDRDAVVEVVNAGKSTEFWNLLRQAIDESIEHLQGVGDSDDIKDLPPDRYKLEMELLKAKKNYLKRLKDYPDVIINRVTDPESYDFNFDPYDE